MVAPAAGNNFTGCLRCGFGTFGTAPDAATRLQNCLDCPAGKLQWRAAQTRCLDCPSEGVDCSSQSRIVVRKGYYRPNDDDPAAVRCPYLDACAGGGAESCTAGHVAAEDHIVPPAVAKLQW